MKQKRLFSKAMKEAALESLKSPTDFKGLWRSSNILYLDNYLNGLIFTNIGNAAAPEGFTGL